MKTNHWSSKQLQTYLTEYKHRLVSSTNYPESISIDESWHELLNKIRESTLHDGHERWSFIGIKQEKIYLRNPLKGGKNTIPSHITYTAEEIAKREGIPIIGTIHSHPIGSIEKLLWQLFRRNIFTGGFSSGDLFALASTNTEVVMVLAAYNENVIALKTVETDSAAFNLKGSMQVKFMEEWDIKPMMSWKRGIQIAKKYRIVLYKGLPNQKLRKVIGNY